MTFFSRLAAFFSAISILFTSIFAEKIVPVFTDKDETTKQIYDEGEFVMGEHDIFVAPYGSDDSEGTIDSPLSTPYAAKEKAKALKGIGEEVTVWFREGEYSLPETLRFTDEDLQNVTYRSYPGENVAFSGAEKISGFAETTVNGVKAFVAEYDAGDNTDGINTLYNGDKRLARSIWPKEGEFSVANVRVEDCFSPDQSNSYFALHAAFYADTNDLLNFKNINDVDVHILHYWNDELLPLHSVNTSNGRVEVAKPASMTISNGDRYFFENVFEALSLPGEWYYDRTEKKIYYIPFDGETAQNTVLKLGTNHQLVTVDNCNAIHFKDITFCDSDWKMTSGEHFNSAFNTTDNPLKSIIKYTPNFPQACYDLAATLVISHSSDISFVGCEFKRIGASGLMFDKGSVNCTVKTCIFDDIGGNAVYIKGVRTKVTADEIRNITVTDCHIKSYGRIFNNAIGVLLIDAYDSKISHNEIHDGFYTAISVGWVWGYTENFTDNIKICDNLIYDIGQGWLSDMGGIYTLGIQPNTVISGNVIHDVGCYAGDTGYGGWGVYLDEGSSGITVENNLAYNCSSQGFHQHYGKDNIIRNNIFALNGEAQIRLSRKEDHNSFTLTGNIILSNDAPIYYNTEKDPGFTDSNNLYWDLERHSNIISSRNPKDPFDRKYMPGMMYNGLYKDGKFADPLFKDALNYDFTLADNSPALEIGFEPWDYTQAGTITDFS